MTFTRAISDTTRARSELRLVVLAQWVQAGLDLARGARAGRSLLGRAVALWQVFQAVRLAIQLSRRLAEAGEVMRSGDRGLAPTPVPASPLEVEPANAAALRRALAELAAAISDAVGFARHGRVSDRDRKPSGLLFGWAPLKTRGPGRRRHGRRTSHLEPRPLRPPGSERPGRRRSRTPDALQTAPTPIATLAIGRDPLARG